MNVTRVARCVILTAIAHMAWLSISDALMAELFRLAPRRDLRAPGARGRATISTTKTELVVGELFDVEVEFEYQAGYDAVFNPFFDTLTEQPAQIAVFDKSGRLLGGLLHRGVSFRSPYYGDWVTMRANSKISNKFRFEALRFSALPPEHEPALMSGKYFVQAVFHSRFISPPLPCGANNEGEAVRAWYKLYTDPDLFRSNILELEVVRPNPGATTWK